MKKRFGLNELREVEVPATLDAKILTAAAFNAARNKKRIFRRKLIAGFSSAAAAAFALAAGLFIADIRDSSVSPDGNIASGQIRNHTAAAAPAAAALPRTPQSSAELENLQDFTNFEQTAFVIGQVTANLTIDNLDDPFI